MSKKPRTYRSLYPNVGIEAQYRKKLIALIDEMQNSIVYWLVAAYRENEPEIIPMAQDVLSANMLRNKIKELRKRWERRFNDMAPKLAEYFAKVTAQRSDSTLQRILKQGGMSVKFKPTKAQKDVMAAIVHENVSLIKSIPQRHLNDVEGLVMRSVQRGRALGELSKELQQRYGVTKRRAALISKDQNNKASGALRDVRQLELGIKKAIWVHSGGGKEPRPSHVAMNGKEYDIKKGMWDRVEQKFIRPGELINCFPGSTTVDFAYGVRKAFRRWYSGELSKIITDSGKTLNATPNHPVLTPDGWRAIGVLNEGDYVVEIADDWVGSGSIGAFVGSIEQNIDNAPIALSKIFGSLVNTGMAVIADGGNFHGDFANCDVDVVLSTGPLSFGRKAFINKSLEEFCFPLPNNSRFGQGSFSQFTFGAFYAANRIMRGLRELLSFFGGAIGHPLVHSFAAVSNLPTDTPNPSLYCQPLVSKFLRERKNTLPRFMQCAQPVRIVGVERCAFSGHVFNLQTRNGYYSTEGIVVHNCRCVSRPVVEGFS